MRTTIAIDDDILAAAKHLAERDRTTVGEVISTLARRGLARAAPPVPLHRNGVPLLSAPGGNSPVTPELVNQLRDELP